MTTVHGSSENARLGAVEYRVLGPVSAFLEAKPRQLGGKRQRMVLAILLSRPNQFVSQDSLIDAVWAGEPPDAAKQTLHAYVSTLRKQLDGGIEREGDGYIVRVENGQLDSLRFQELVDRGRAVIESSPLEASSLLREGLALWQGPAFGDLNGEPALVSEVVRLEGARLTAIEYRVDADLRSGNHQTVVQELEALTREHPFRERLEGFLMLALYRSGRQADALRSYRRAQLFLADELGIDPSPGLQVLEEQILQQSPELDWSEQTHIAPMARGSARGYELREKVDENRYGVFYRGFQGSVGREVMVLSLMEEFSSDPEFVRRFESELGAVSQLEHPHLLPIYDFWRDPDGAFLVTAYLRGGPLRDSISHEPWNLSSALPLMDQIGSALGFAHRNGFTHGLLDIDSIGLDDDHNAYIIDLGLSSLVRTQGDRSALPDVEGLARIVFSSLTGVHNPRGGRISEVRSDLAVLDPVFQRAFNPDPASRYQKVEDFRRAFRQAAGADIVPPSEGIIGDQRRNPYKGLRAFQESDATDFHGRDALVEDLIEILASGRILAVVGPSGSGKSSLVRAGLLSALRNNAIEGSGSWLITEMFPGTHPFEELEAAILRVAVARPSGLTDDLTADPRGLIRIAKEVLPTEGDELVLVVDQLEELFSLTPSETDRKLFIDTIIAAVSDERSRIRVVLTLRADFFDQPLRYSNFGEVLGMGLVPVGPPTDDGLARAVAQPARAVGVDLEPGLVTRIVDDVRDEPGGLPLMQHVLTELFIQREHNTLTLAAYEQSGGVLGALGKRAEEIYEGLTADGKEAARQLFLRLVMVDELADDTRRRVRQTELKNLEIRQETLDGVIARFGSFRLLSFDRDAATRTPTVEVAHEALIREWARLRTWIDERREDLLIHRRIQVTVRDWEDSRKDQSYLLRGNRLEQALIWQERTDIAISVDEMTFIEASIEQEKRDQAEHQALEDKAARRRKAVISSLAGGLVVAGILGVVALDRAGDAELASVDARARELAVLAADTTDDDPERGMLLAMESINLSREAGLDPLPEAIGALQTATQKNRVVARFPDANLSVYVNSDGTMIATDSQDASSMNVNLWDVASQDIVEVLPGPEIPVPEGAEPELHIAFSPDGRWLAVGRHVPDPTCVEQPGDTDPKRCGLGGLEVRDLHTNVVTVLIPPTEGFAAPSVFSPDGSYLAALSNDGLLVWDRDLQLTEGFVDGGVWVGPAIDVDFVGTSPQIAIPLTIESRLTLIDPETGSESGSLPTPDLNPDFAAVDPSGKRFVVGDFNQARVQLINIETETVMEVKSTSRQALRWHPDSETFAVSGNGAVIEVFDGTTADLVLTLDAHKSSVFQFAYSPNGKDLFSASVDQGVIMWSITPEGPEVNGAIVVEGDGFRVLDTAPDGIRGSSTLLGQAIVFDIETGTTISQFDLESAIFNETLEFVAGSEPAEDPSSLSYGIWDTETRERVAIYDRCTIPKAISPDGTLVLVTNAVDVEGCGTATENGSQENTSARVENVRSGEVVLDLPGVFVQVATFSPAGTFDDHSFLAVNHGPTFGTTDVYSIPDGDLLGRFSQDLLLSGLLVVRFSPDGRVLGIGMNLGLVAAASMERLVEGASEMQSLLINQIGHDGNAPRPAVATTGIIATTAFDQWVRLWDLSTNRKLVEFQTGPVPRLPSVAFTSDEEFLLYTDKGAVIRSYPMDIEVLLARAGSTLTRTLTDDECRQYLHTDGCVD